MAKNRMHRKWAQLLADLKEHEEARPALGPYREVLQDFLDKTKSLKARRKERSEAPGAVPTEA
ncbi:MAG TPA: hypothetical protein VKK31_08990, partial [Thermoanaerobaculia bacterium]|nr:hypothetical protein [Thermoanaerobaculia bacterium]